MNNTIIYALDFDGVICDSAIETGMSGWKAACQLWPDMPAIVPAELIGQFRLVRPIIETGYEAILTMRMLYLGEPIETIYNGYADDFRRLMDEVQVNSEDLKKLFGDVRDVWIAHDRAEWIQGNPLYPGVSEKLAQLNQTCTWYVITTKQERFVKKILRASQIDLGDEQVFGLDRNLSKPDILKMLVQQHPGRTLHFVEDRLPALLKVRQEPALAAVELFFADWGYNTAVDKVAAKEQGFNYQYLHEFLN
jgi:phosphoglycolate phosphatase-like HAD superfamily hydrolase